MSCIYQYKCVFTHFHNFAVFVHRSRVRNKAVNVEYVLTSDVRLCACSSRSTFLSVHSKVDLFMYRSKTQHVVRKSVHLDEYLYVGGISTDMAYLWTVLTSYQIVRRNRNVNSHKLSQIYLHISTKRWGYFPNSAFNKQKVVKLAVFTYLYKIFLTHDMRAYKGNEGIAALILNLGGRWRWVIILTY
jgi:hypothetical protein